MMSGHEPPCACPDCVAARNKMVRESHPLMQKRAGDPAPTMIPISQALAMELEAKEELESRLAQVKANIRNLRDCA
jgi:hypothetical protein